MPNVDISWLHLTDLHVGMTEQKWLWSTVKHAVLDDISRLRDKVSDIDFVIFSGDLVQGGTDSEFQKLNQILEEIWSRLKTVGCRPLLFHVPGNHDLIRPQARDPSFLAINRWWEDVNVQDDFWSNQFDYLDRLKRLFSGYTSWSENLCKSGSIPLMNGCRGLLPGDQASVFTKDGNKVGLIGLNSTWLQFFQGDLRGKLAVDVRQLHEITQGDPKTWCGGNHVNILVTHQPSNWLHPLNASVWESEINPSGRFDIHLSGHMHEPVSSATSTFGSDPRISLQGPSLFGLEYLGDGSKNRIHGLSLLNIKDSEERRKLAVWPRVLNRSGAGNYSIIPDYKFELREEKYLLVDKLMIKPHLPAPSVAIVPPTSAEGGEAAPSTESLISALKFQLPQDAAHEVVRRLDQRNAHQALSRDRMCWIVSEWGMASDEFIYSSLKTLDKSQIPSYKLNLSSFKDRMQLSIFLRETYGFGLESFIDQLAEAGHCVLILDEITTGKLEARGTSSIEQNVEELCGIILEYCPDVYIVLKCRSTPLKIKKTFVQLGGFDAVDLRAYVAAKKGSHSDLCDLSSVQTLLRHTDGVPVRLYSALEELEVISISELINSNSDLVSEIGTSLEQAESKNLRKNSRRIKGIAEPDITKIL